jgi:transcriptional regulator with XRE-family HTH domain
MSQEALAHRVGLHPTYISSVERGLRNVSLNNIVRIAAGLGVDPAELVQGLRA